MYAKFCFKRLWLLRREVNIGGKREHFVGEGCVESVENESGGSFAKETMAIHKEEVQNLRPYLGFMERSFHSVKGGGRDSTSGLQGYASWGGGGGFGREGK